MTNYIGNLGAIHRYYESRRRIINDQKPNRVKKVAENKKNAQKVAFQKRVRIYLLPVWLTGLFRLGDNLCKCVLMNHQSSPQATSSLIISGHTFAI